MVNWSEFALSTVTGMTSFESFCRMIQDMLRTTLNFRDFKEYSQLKYPLLSVASGSPYTMEQIKDGINTLANLGVHSFVLLESSTYCLTLICQLLDLSKAYPDLKISLSISNSYHKVVNSKWGLTHNLDGLLIKITRTK